MMTYFITNLINLCVSYVESFGLMGGFLLVVLESIIPALPLAVFIGFNVMAFGNVVGFIVSYFGTLFGCILSFLFFRYGFKEWINSKFHGKKKENILKLEKRITKMKFTNLVVMIAVPFAPAFLINIAAGISDISLKKFVGAIVISKLVIIYFWGYIGTNLLESVQHPVILVKIFVLLLLSFAISKVVEKIFDMEV